MSVFFSFCVGRQCESKKDYSLYRHFHPQSPIFVCSSMDPIPTNEFIDLALATQASRLESQPTKKTFDRVPSSSVRNPQTGLLECGMCFEPMGGEASLKMAVPPCGHAYCQNCLVAIVRQSGGKCPQCRRDFTENEITTVYS